MREIATNKVSPAIVLYASLHPTFMIRSWASDGMIIAAIPPPTAVSPKAIPRRRSNHCETTLLYGTIEVPLPNIPRAK
jgi:hypothetical protein